MGDLILHISFGRPVGRNAMEKVLNNADHFIGRVVETRGFTRPFLSSDQPLRVSSEGLLLTTARQAPSKALTWGLLDIAVVGLKVCGYQEGRYQEMSTVVYQYQGWSGRVLGTLDLK